MAWPAPSIAALAAAYAQQDVEHWEHLRPWELHFQSQPHGAALVAPAPHIDSLHDKQLGLRHVTTTPQDFMADPSQPATLGLDQSLWDLSGGGHGGTVSAVTSQSAFDAGVPSISALAQWSPSAQESMPTPSTGPRETCSILRTIPAEATSGCVDPCELDLQVGHALELAEEDLVPRWGVGTSQAASASSPESPALDADLSAAPIHSAETSAPDNRDDVRKVAALLNQAWNRMVLQQRVALQSIDQ